MFALSSKNRLTDHDLDRFPDDTLFHRLARAVCRAGCLPRKELFEAWEMARRVRRRFRGGRVVDVGGGHGLLAHVMLLLDSSSTSAVVVDPGLPPSRETLRAQLALEWPELEHHVTFIEGTLGDVTLQATDVVVSCHACGALTDTVLERAVAAQARVAVLPCCHDLDACDPGSLRGWLDGPLAVDVMRTVRVEARGYRTWLQTIPDAITPKNRLLVAAPSGVRRTPRASTRALTSAVLTLALSAVAASAQPAQQRWIIGLSTTGAPIEAISIAGRSPTSPTVLLVGGLEQSDRSSEAVAREAAAFERLPQNQRAFQLMAIPRANPDARPLQFPPTGVAYREQVDSHVVWRWVGTHAPDVVLVAGPDRGLVDALAQNDVADVGRIPARRVDDSTPILQSFIEPIPRSPAHQEIERRLARSPRVFAEELARVYGREFTQPTYIGAVAVVSRLRLGESDDVTRLLAPYLDGTRDSFARPSQSSLASHLLFFEYARRARDDRARALVLRAAGSGFTETGALREFMPLHGGWSDSLFMDVPILTMAGALTGEQRYFDMAARHVTFMQQIVLRPDGLYRHQASTDAAWGRGNAFPALGMALTLSQFPATHPEYPRLVVSYRAHMAALARAQDENGMWRNVIDRPGAYPEYSATAMIGTAMLRGIRNGWIDRETYEPLVQKAWTAILARTGTEGRLVDVCESTGTRGLTADDYLHRAAILGRDDRGGGMAMFFATELAGLSD